MSCLGIIANPQSGKDIRRLVALATSVSNHEKLLIVRRVMAGAEAVKVEKILLLDDTGSLGKAAYEMVREGGGRQKTKVHLLNIGARGESADTTRAAAQMKEKGAACIVVLGGDGTSRAAAKGCGSCPLVPLSTGTNNAFSQAWEGTSAGLGAGLYARTPRRYAHQVASSKRLVVHLSGNREIALVDVGLVNETFAGSRAVWDIDLLEALALTSCRPGGLGLSALGASIAPISPKEPDGLWIEFARGGKKGKRVLFPIGPGLVTNARIKSSNRISQGHRIELLGRLNQVLAFDGEREYLLNEGERVGIELDQKGPRVLLIPKILELAALKGYLTDRGQIA